jgi:G:T-mismatch repair DNA endonuclease (very short patch repair protein)
MKEKRYLHKHIKNQEIRYKYCELGMPTTLIAKEYGVSSSTISCRLKDIGVEIRDASHALQMKWLKDGALDRYQIDEEWLKIEYVDKKRPMSEIAQEIGCNVDVIKRRLVKANIYVRSMGESKKGRKWTSEAKESMKQKLKRFPSRKKYSVPKDDLYHKYIELGMSCGDIAKELGSSKTVVSRKLIEYGIPKRTAKESQNMPKYLEKRTKLKEKYLKRRDVIYDVLPNSPVIGTLIDGRLAGYKGEGICVWTKCPDCGDYKWKRLNNVRNEKYGGLCVKCVRNHPEYKRNMSISSSERFKNPSEKAKLAEGKRLFSENHPEYREERRRKAKLAYSTDEAKQMMKERTNKYWSDPIYGEERRKEQAKRHSDNLVTWWEKPEYRELKSNQSIELWANAEYKDMMVKKVRKASNIRPNKTENAIVDILNELYPDDWKYVGDGEVVLGGKNPDIINCNGRKAIIEVNGTYWHSKANTKECPLLHQIDRIDHYKKYGYHTLIIWESEIKNKVNIIKKLHDFYVDIDNYHQNEGIVYA